LFAICNNCSDEIGKKFTPTLLIDKAKLRLLKQKIRKNRTHTKRRSNNI